MDLNASFGDVTSWVYDPLRDDLLMTTSAGDLKAWNVGKGAYDYTVHVGGTPSSMDISNDARYLIIGNHDRTVTSGPFDFHTTYAETFTRVDLTTQTPDTISMSEPPNTFEESYELGVSDVAFNSSYGVLFTTNFAGSGWNPFREFQIDPPTPAFSLVSGLNQIDQSSYLTPSEDHRYIFIQEANSSDGPLEIYDTISDKIVASTNLYNFGFSGFNTAGGTISTSAGKVVDVLYNNVFVFDLALKPVANLSLYTQTGAVIGSHFSDDGKELFLWQGAAHTMLVLDTATWLKVDQFDVGVSTSTGYVGAPYGDMALIHNGQAMVLDTGSGLQVIDLTTKLALTVTGDDTSQVLHGGVGMDTVMGGGGADTIDGGISGANYLRGDDGDDTIQGGADFDDINGNVGNDTGHGGAGNDWVVGGKDEDSLYGDDGDDIVYGNLGDDSCDGGIGNDLIRGGQGNDILAGGTGNDWMSGDLGSDTLTGGAGADTFHTFATAGMDRVLDFNAAEGDRVQVDSGSSYTLSQQGANTVIDFGGGNEMVLVGVRLSALPEGWIFTL